MTQNLTTIKKELKNCEEINTIYDLTINDNIKFITLKGNEEYFFRKEGKDMFFHGENRKQLVLPATPYNIDIMKEITGNDMY